MIPFSSTISVSTITSTGNGPEGWRAWWREEAIRTGTDWPSLAWQQLGALNVVLAFCGSSRASS